MGDGIKGLRNHASIHNRPTWIIGRPPGGWQGAAASDPLAQLLPFRFEVQGDETGGYLLILESTDGVYAADTWHETMAGAFGSAEDGFGVRPDEWERPQDP